MICVAALLALTACSATPTLDARQTWKPDGNGQFVHTGNGHVISEAQYTEIVALQVRNLVGERIARTPNYCPTPKK